MVVRYGSGLYGADVYGGAVRPSLASRVAFGSPPDIATPTYDDASLFLLALATRRGRNYERDQIDAGTAQPTYDDGDRRFDATYTHSPYWPDVVPMVRMQHVASWAEVDYPLHTGYVERWPIHWEGPSWGTVTPQASDAFVALSQAFISGTFPEETTGARIARVLAAIAWPTATGDPGAWVLDISALDSTAILSYGPPPTAIDTGLATVQAVTIPAEQPVSALQHIQETAAAEPGVFFFDGNGVAVFQDRHHRFDQTPAAVFSDQPAADEIQYEELQPDYDVSKVVNEVIATSTIGGVPVTATAEDPDSRARYFRRTETLNLPLTSANALQDRANFELVLYAQPALRFDRIVVRPGGQVAAWPTVLGLELGDKVTVKRTPGSVPNVAETITKSCFVEAIEHTVTQNDWTVAFQLSPGAYYEDVWTLDTSTLDSTTVLVY